VLGESALDKIPYGINGSERDHVKSPINTYCIYTFYTQTYEWACLEYV
jgi:hypothetical protein